MLASLVSTPTAHPATRPTIAPTTPHTGRNDAVLPARDDASAVNRRGTRPALISRRQRAISCRHSTSVAPIAVHSFDLMPTFGTSNESKAYGCPSRRSG